MIWTEDLLRAAALLGLDPENPRHRDLLAKCIDEALNPPVRGRPKGSGIWDDAALSDLAHLVDFVKTVLVQRGNSVSDTEILGGGSWGIRDGLVFRINMQNPIGAEIARNLFQAQERHISIDTLRNRLIRGRQIRRLHK